jgi:hypothetical protein
MKKMLILVSTAEALTGALLLVYPSIVAMLLFGSDIAGIGMIVSRFTGICLIALAVACWPGSTENRGFYGMTTYSASAAVYLGYVGIGGESIGKFLWPAVVVHFVIAAALVEVWLKEGRLRKTGNTE